MNKERKLFAPWGGPVHYRSEVLAHVNILDISPSHTCGIGVHRSKAISYVCDDARQLDVSIPKLSYQRFAALCLHTSFFFSYLRCGNVSMATVHLSRPCASLVRSTFSSHLTNLGIPDPTRLVSLLFLSRSLPNPDPIPLPSLSKGNLPRTEGRNRMDDEAAMAMASEEDEREAVYVGYQERRTSGKKGKVLEYYLVEAGARRFRRWKAVEKERWRQNTKLTRRARTPVTATDPTDVNFPDDE
eukprot:scaffold682_cov363-Pavlova_lutheri.AAC.13